MYQFLLLVVCEWSADQLFSGTWRLRQIIDLSDTADKTQYFVITKSIIFFIIWAVSLFWIDFISITDSLGKTCHYLIKSMCTIEHMSRILFAEKDIYIYKRIIQPIFLGSYLQVKWKGRQSTLNDNWSSVTKLATHVSCGIEV